MFASHVKNAPPRARIANARRGLTLIEVLIVIAILLAIGGIIVVNLLPAKDQADIDLQTVQFDQIDGAMKKFRLDLSRYPSEDEGLAVLMRKDALQDEAEAARWRGPYLEMSVTKDKWNREIVYRYPSEEMGEGYYDLVSPGPDGELETEDDITNHDRIRGEDGAITPTDEDFGPPVADGASRGGGG